MLFILHTALIFFLNIFYDVMSKWAGFVTTSEKITDSVSKFRLKAVTDLHNNG